METKPEKSDQKDSPKPLNEEKEDKTEEVKEDVNAYAKYMGVGFQIVATILIGFFVGRWLDRHFNRTTPIFTIILSSLMIVVALYQFIRQFLKS